jgi:hypothetical protein
LRHNYYDTLGLAPTATDSEIKAAYRRLSKAWHPDVNASAQASTRFAAIAHAYEVLGHPGRRLAYDRQQAFAPRRQTDQPLTYDSFARRQAIQKEEVRKRKLMRVLLAAGIPVGVVLAVAFLVLLVASLLLFISGLHTGNWLAMGLGAGIATGQFWLGLVGFRQWRRQRK